MDLLQLAQHRFEQIAPLLLRPMTAETSDVIEQWLRDQVCPVVALLIQSKRFQRLALWSADHLAPKAETPQRRLVEAVDRALVTAANEIAIADRPILPRVDPPSQPKRTADETSDTDLSSHKTGLTTSPVIEWLAERPWFDLVCNMDYFIGEQGLHLKKGRIDCSTEFWRTDDPRVPLGDYVTRAMLHRIAFFARKIDEAWQPCFFRVQLQGQAGYALAEGLFKTKVELDQALTELRKACNVGTESRLRDACTTLVHVYTAYDPNPHLAWLGCPESWPAVMANMIRQTIRPPGEVTEVQPVGSGRYRVVGRRRVNLCRPDVIHGIAGALAAVAEIYRRPAETEELIGWLRQEKRLLMVDHRPRTVYWDGEAVGKDWEDNSALWDLLWMLARGAQRRQPVQKEDVSRPGRRGSALKHRRRRLSSCIPSALDALIEPVRPGGYRLILAPDDIARLTLDHEEQLIEVGPETKGLLE